MKVVECQSLDGGRKCIPSGGVTVVKLASQIIIYAACKPVAEKASRALGLQYRKHGELFVFSDDHRTSVREINLLLAPIR